MKQYKPFQFKQFSVVQNNAAMKVGTDSVLLGAWAIINPKERILDIGTGTGILSLMLAQKVNGDCQIDAIEIDAEAIKDACLNFKNSPWFNSLNLIQQDFNLLESDDLYDVIISNPPFFEGLASSNKSRSIARNASHKLSYKNLLTGVSKLLTEEGRFYLIIPQEYFEKVIFIGKVNGLHLFKQLNIMPKPEKPINRVLIGLIKTNNPVKTGKSGKLIVRSENNLYTNEHRLLTGAYYL
ncbi:MAG: methyltransferase [Cyclobacteriaceae bacterium]|nr:methyltransferase [Cyclobacteriaceae bacterium]